MKMTISNLPSDLVEDIVSRVPLKSMKAVQLTCKNWNALFKSQSFTKMHIGKEDEAARQLGGSRMIVLMDYNLHLMSIVVNENPSKESLGKLICLNEQVKIYQVFQCEGLLLCILEDDNTKIVVWNPYLGQTRWIKTKYSNTSDMKYAIGYKNKKNKSCPSHKILRFHTNTITTSHDYDIYDFDSDLWKTSDVTPNWEIEYCDYGVSYKGNTYWFARKKKSQRFIEHIICFDFTKERFGPLLLLPFYIVDSEYLVTLSCVREEKLAALIEPHQENKLEFWITTKIEAESVSWSKFLTLDREPDYIVLYRSFFIDEEKKVVAICIDEAIDWNQHNTLSITGETGYLRQLKLGERGKKYSKKIHMFSYVPSLVQIKQLRNPSM